MGMPKSVIALGAIFSFVSLPAAGDYAYAARNTEPYSCKINGRVYNPASASIAVDAATGEILSGSDIDAPRYPASMTKMMTALLIFEALEDGRLNLNDQLTMQLTPDVLAVRGYSNSTWLNAGTTLTVEEAIKAIAVASANNVSVMMAEHIAGSEADFVKLMNEKAQDLGMTNTNFQNSHGGPLLQNNRPSAVSTARDMAKLAFHLYDQYPQYYPYFTAPKAEFGPWRGRQAKYNHNELAMKNRDIDGIKTGFTCASGYNIAASAFSRQDRVISIVFGGRTPQQRNVLTDQLMTSALNLLDRRDHDARLAANTGQLGYIDDNVNQGNPSTALAGNASPPPSNNRPA